MIRVEKRNNIITIKGHAHYADAGSDIVCSAVSSIVTTTVNACIRFDSDSIKYNNTKNKMVIEVINNSKEINILIDNMIDLLNELMEQYPKNINIKED